RRPAGGRADAVGAGAGAADPGGGRGAARSAGAGRGAVRVGGERPSRGGHAAVRRGGAPAVGGTDRRRDGPRPDRPGRRLDEGTEGTQPLSHDRVAGAVVNGG